VAGCQADGPKATGVPAAKVDGPRVSLPADSPQRNSLVVDAAAIRQADATRLTGRMVWDEDATVRVYSPVSGRVTDLPATVGQRTAANAVLAALASPDYNQAQADVRKAAADLLLADRSYARLKELLDRGAAAGKDVEAAEDALTTARSERDRALAHLAVYGGSADVADQPFLLRAPIGGVVVERNVTRGQEVRADMILGNVPQAFLPLFVISDPTRLWVVLDATEMDMPRLKPRQRIAVRTRAYPDRVFPGTLDLVGDAVDPATRTVKVRGSVPNLDRLLKAEMYVTVDVASDAPPSVEISAKAVFRKDNQPFVFVEMASGRYERRPVRLGTEAEGRIAVLEGLQAGQRVVTEGCLLLETILEAGSKS
jgi:cobalt-zinc-cadmium efflux system membrane fusion protein